MMWNFHESIKLLNKKKKREGKENQTVLRKNRGHNGDGFGKRQGCGRKLRAGVKYDKYTIDNKTAKEFIKPLILKSTGHYSKSSQLPCEVGDPGPIPLKGRPCLHPHLVRATAGSESGLGALASQEVSLPGGSRRSKQAGPKSTSSWLNSLPACFLGFLR